MATITEWLASLGLPKYARRFAENGIDFSVLGHLSDQDLKDLGVLLGHRSKLQAAGGIMTKLRLLNIERAQVGGAPTLFESLPLAGRPRRR